MKIKDLLISLIIIAVGVTAVSGAHADSGKTANGLNLNAYCTSIGEGGNASVITGTQDWACSNNGTGDAINLHKACQFEYKTGELRQLVANDPYTYACMK